MHALKFGRAIAACIFGGLMLATMPGCQHQEGLVTRAPVSYLFFTGKAAGTVARIDDSQMVSLNQEHVASKTRFAVEPGRHRVQIERAGSVVVDRIILLVDQQSMEIPVP
jgi:hypothetical protein